MIGTRQNPVNLLSQQMGVSETAVQTSSLFSSSSGFADFEDDDEDEHEEDSPIARQFQSHPHPICQLNCPAFPIRY